MELSGKEVRGTDILLNGEPVFLRGICAHEEAPYRGGRAFSDDDARTQLRWIKELGGNFVRLAHYPHNETIVREADRQGHRSPIDRLVRSHLRPARHDSVRPMRCSG